MIDPMTLSFFAARLGMELAPMVFDAFLDHVAERVTNAVIDQVSCRAGGALEQLGNGLVDKVASQVASPSFSQSLGGLAGLGGAVLGKLGGLAGQEDAQAAAAEPGTPSAASMASSIRDQVRGIVLEEMGRTGLALVAADELSALRAVAAAADGQGDLAAALAALKAVRAGAGQASGTASATA